MRNLGELPLLGGLRGVIGGWLGPRSIRDGELNVDVLGVIVWEEDDDNQLVEVVITHGTVVNVVWLVVELFGRFRCWRKRKYTRAWGNDHEDDDVDSERSLSGGAISQEAVLPTLTSDLNAEDYESEGADSKEYQPGGYEVWESYPRLATFYRRRSMKIRFSYQPPTQHTITLSPPRYFDNGGTRRGRKVVLHKFGLPKS